MAHKRQSHRKREKVEAVLQKVVDADALLKWHASLPDAEAKGDSSRHHIPWYRLPEELNPAAGALSQSRAGRKRLQLDSMLHLLESHGFIENGERVLEIGAGSGHLGLLLAYLFSHKGVTVTAVELSKEKLALMRERAHQLRLRNFHVHPGSGSDYKGASQSNAIDLVVGLHACGPLTDLALDIAAESRAKFCLVPCCYGQLAEAPQIVDRIEAQNEVVPAATLVREYPRSERVGNWMSQAEFQSVARVADIGSSRPGNGQQRKRGMWIGELTPSCKSLINFDRAQRLLENDGFEVRFRELSPPTCSSKREVLLGAPPEK